MHHNFISFTLTFKLTQDWPPITVSPVPKKNFPSNRAPFSPLKLKKFCLTVNRCLLLSTDWCIQGLLVNYILCIIVSHSIYTFNFSKTFCSTVNMYMGLSFIFVYLIYNVTYISVLDIPHCPWFHKTQKRKNKTKHRCRYRSVDLENWYTPTTK